MWVGRVKSVFGMTRHDRESAIRSLFFVVSAGLLPRRLHWWLLSDSPRVDVDHWELVVFGLHDVTIVMSLDELGPLRWRSPGW